MSDDTWKLKTTGLFGGVEIESPTIKQPEYTYKSGPSPEAEAAIKQANELLEANFYHVRTIHKRLVRWIKRLRKQRDQYRRITLKLPTPHGFEAQRYGRRKAEEKILAVRDKLAEFKFNPDDQTLIQAIDVLTGILDQDTPTNLFTMVTVRRNDDDTGFEATDDETESTGWGESLPEALEDLAHEIGKFGEGCLEILECFAQQEIERMESEVQSGEEDGEQLRRSQGDGGEEHGHSSGSPGERDPGEGSEGRD